MDMKDTSKYSPELLAGLQQMKVQLGYAEPEPIVEEKKEETKEEEVKPVVKEKDDDITTWSDEQLEVLAASQSELAKDAQAILNKRGVDGFQSEEAKEIKALRKDLSKERKEEEKATEALKAMEYEKALRDRARNGDQSAINELLAPHLQQMNPYGFDHKKLVSNVRKSYESEDNKKDKKESK